MRLIFLDENSINREYAARYDNNCRKRRKLNFSLCFELIAGFEWAFNILHLLESKYANALPPHLCIPFTNLAHIARIYRVK